MNGIDQGPAQPASVKARWIRLALVAVAVILLLLLVIVVRNRSSSDEESETSPVVSVQVARAVRGTIAEEISVVGTLVPVREAEISPKIAAPIASMGLLKNRVVRQGDVIATLDSREVAAQRATNEAEDQKSLADARAAAANARAVYERRRQLYDDGGISKKNLDESKLALTQAEEDLRLAERMTVVHRSETNPLDLATMKSSGAQLESSVVRAPFSGVITGQFQYQGDYANPGQKMVSIADTSSMIVKIPVAGEMASHVKAGDPANVLPDDLPGRQIAGRVTLVGYGADVQSRAVEVWVALPNSDGQLRPNSTARVVLSARQQTDAVVVPASAVTLDATSGSSGTVMVVDGNSVAHEVHVTVGIRTKDREQITSGLKGGETVVTEGNYGLPDGTKVTVTPPSQDADR